ncbi:14075_t:CDS:2 [Entrophospora sp. SA101]|nr:14075_t:CDS:2 [Entrophospora sp. SA101]
MYIYDEDYDILGVDDVDDKEEDLIDDKDVVLKVVLFVVNF